MLRCTSVRGFAGRNAFSFRDVSEHLMPCIRPCSVSSGYRLSRTTKDETTKMTKTTKTRNDMVHGGAEIRKSVIPSFILRFQNQFSISMVEFHFKSFAVGET